MEQTTNNATELPPSQTVVPSTQILGETPPHIQLPPVASRAPGEMSSQMPIPQLVQAVHDPATDHDCWTCFVNWEKTYLQGANPPAMSSL